MSHDPNSIAAIRQPTRTLLLAMAFCFAATSCKIKEAPKTAATDPTPSSELAPAKGEELAQLAQLARPARLSNRADFDEPGAVLPDGERLPPPLDLTASDGSGLELRQLQARAVIDGPLAFTELRLRFHNPEPRRREGRFNITLPGGAAVSRFAMKIAGSWMEGEVVEKQRARRIYEDFLHRKQDPAILEQDAGNVFSARVFPIEAGADKELIISWSQTLADPRAALTLPLAGLPRLQELSIEAFVHSGRDKAPAPTTLSGGSAHMEVVAVRKRDFEPLQDFIVWPGHLQAPWDALRQGRRLVARITPPGGAANDHFEQLVVLFDTSASTAPRFAGRVEALAGLLAFAGRHGAKAATVIAFDQDTETIWRGQPDAFDSAARERLLARAALGASNLEGALLAAARAAAAMEGQVRVIMFGDGIVTAGQHDGRRLQKRVAALADAGVVRMDALTMATARDDGVLSRLVGGPLSRHGVVVALTGHEYNAFDRFALRTFAPIGVAIDGADWVWPRRIEGLQAGQQALIYAELPPGAPAEIRLTGGVTGSLTPRWRAGAEPLIERATVKARIDALLAEADEGQADLAASRRAQALKLSLHHRVLCSMTALLVLETENDYARYGIDRNALADVLAVSPHGIAIRQKRQQLKLALSRIFAEAPVADAPDGGDAKDEASRRAVIAKKSTLGIIAASGAQASRLFADGEASAKKPVRVAKAKPRMAPPPSKAPPRGALSDAKGSGGSIVKMSGGGASGAGAMMRMRPAQRPSVRVVRVDAQDKKWARSAHLVLHRHNRSIGYCLRNFPNVGAFSGIRFTVETTGRVSQVRITGMSGGPTNCIASRIARARFSPPRQRQTVRAWYDMSGGNVYIPPTALANPLRQRPRSRPDPAAQGRAELARIERALRKNGPWRDDYGRIREQLAAGHVEEALRAARTWRQAQVGDVMALVALGDAARAHADLALAARAYGSIIDLYPSRADTRRFAGDLLQQLGAKGSDLAIDTFTVASADRPDHPTGFHLLAMALAAAGRYDDALAAVDKGLKSSHRGTARAIDKVLRDDAADIAAAAIAQDPGRKEALTARLQDMGTRPTSGARLRVVLTWETDANDVDLHVFDSDKQHAWFKRRHLQGGRGQLYKTAFGGYGPEAFVVNRPRHHPYRLFAFYYRMGPMGWGMGQAQIIRTDGKGGLGVEARAYVLQRDKAYVDLGAVTDKTAAVGG